MRRGAVAGLIIVGLILGSLIVYGSGLDENRKELREEIYLAKRTLLKYRSLLARAESINSELEELKGKYDELSTGLFEKGNPSVVHTRVQKILGDYIKDSTLTVVSIRTLKPVDLGFLTGFPVELNLSGDIRQLGMFLSELEKSPLLISIDKLSVRVANVREPGLLRIGITLSGYAPASGKDGENRDE